MSEDEPELDEAETDEQFIVRLFEHGDDRPWTWDDVYRLRRLAERGASKQETQPTDNVHNWDESRHY